MHARMMTDPHDYLPLGSWINAAVRFLVDHNGGLFDAAGLAIERFAAGVEQGLQALPVWLVIAVVAGVAWRRVSWGFGLAAAAGLGLIALLGCFALTMATLALTLSATGIGLLLGVPLGILAARSARVHAVLRPLLDFMQTMPAFVYLIPAVMLFGLGRVPGVLATVVIVTSMVGAGGLGGEVLSSIQQLDVGLGFESGSCVVLLAIILDRITQSFGRPAV